MAVWAAGRLFDAGEFAALAQAHAHETDEDVAREWSRASAGLERA
jgi:hypothetical protein